MKTPVYLFSFICLAISPVVIYGQFTGIDAKQIVECAKLHGGFQHLNKKQMQILYNWGGHLRFGGFDTTEVYRILGAHPQATLDLVSCFLAANDGGDASPELKEEIYFSLPRNVRVELIGRPRDFNMGLGEQLLEMDSIGFAKDLLLDTSEYDDYNESILRSAILSNYGLLTHPDSALHKAINLYNLEFKHVEGWYNPHSDIPNIKKLFTRMKAGKKIRLVDVPLIIIP